MQYLELNDYKYMPVFLKMQYLELNDYKYACPFKNLIFLIKLLQICLSF